MKMLGNIISLLIQVILLMTPSMVFSADFIEIKTPPETHIAIFGTTATSNEDASRHFFEKNLTYPLNIEFTGPLGGIVRKSFQSEPELRNYNLSSGIITDKNSRPELLIELPAICPRVFLQKNQPPLYLGQFDRINHIPAAQLLDPDFKKNLQYKTYTEIDGKNILLLKKIKITNDYEDSQILDYEGPHPLTGKHQIIYEGEGGFYANIHYAIIPYSKGVDQLDRQQLLHLAQGKLVELEYNLPPPVLRTHSFIPGPFLSKSSTLYDMCEWGDTTYQAKIQEMNYQNIALWDWDYSVPNSDHVWLIVWEGDEEEWMVKEQLLSPFTLTDDIIGVFEVKRKKTLKPITLTNSKGDFEITIQTGDMDILNK